MKWLSEVINEDELKIGVLNMITANTGCGKTTWAVDYLMRKVNNKYQVVYLIDTLAAKDQLIWNDKRFKEYDVEWRRCVVSEMIAFGDNSIILMTYAKFGALTRHFPEMKEHFKVIICDEIHSLPIFAEIPRKSNEEFNYAEDAIIALEEIVRQKNTMVIGLTATPQKVYSRFSCSKNIFELGNELRQYETKHTVKYRSLKTLLLLLEREKVGLIFVTHIHEIEEIVSFANANGYRAIGLWSVHAAGKPFTEEQNEVRDYLIRRRAMPPQYNLLILNAAYETSITIGGKIDYVIIQRNNPDSLIQARGRIRGDLDTLYLPDKSAEIIVPKEYLNRPLSKEERDELSEILAIENNLKWTGIKKILPENGYTIEENKRINNKRYYTIHDKTKNCQN